MNMKKILTVLLISVAVLTLGYFFLPGIVSYFQFSDAREAVQLYEEITELQEKMSSLKNEDSILKTAHEIEIRQNRYEEKIINFAEDEMKYILSSEEEINDRHESDQSCRRIFLF